MAQPRILVLAAMASVGLAACGGSSTTGAAPSKPDKVQIAAEGPFTGNQAFIGEGALRAITLAVKDFNTAGGVNGTPVTLVTWDDQHNAQTAQTFQQQGISDTTILGIVGPMNSGVANGTEKGLQAATPPLPFVSESASDVAVTDSGNSVAHRVCARDDQQGPADAKFMIEQGAKKVFVMDAKSDYSIGLADKTEAALKAKNIPTQRESVKGGGPAPDFSTIIQKIKSFGADWVYFADEGPEAAPLVSQMKQKDLTIGQNIQFLGSDGEDSASIITDSQGAYLGAYATNITADPAGLTTTAAQNFVAEYKAAYPADGLAKAGPFYGSAYEAAQVLLQAIKSSPVKNGKISRADVQAHLASDTFHTIFGDVKFNAKGDVATGGIFVFQAKGTQMVVVKQISG
jgi:branched-chain amino acid transport system substrate-binding protein